MLWPGSRATAPIGASTQILCPAGGEGAAKVHSFALKRPASTGGITVRFLGSGGGAGTVEVLSLV